jgi:hypothetical protein
LKRIKYILFLIILLHSCDGKPIDWNLLGEQLEITASIHNNEVDITEWNNNDSLGLFLFAPDTKSNNSILSYNINYNNENNASNIFHPSSELQAIYPQNNNLPVNLIGYYPYNKDLKDTQYQINISEITKIASRPFLYSDNCKNISLNKPHVSMVFEHQLSKLFIEIKNNTSNDINDINISISNLPKRATFDLQTGVFSDYYDIGDITLKNNNSNNTAETLLLPFEIPHDSYIKLNINNVAHYRLKTSEILNTSKLIKAKKYKVILKLSNDIDPELTSEIIDWESIYFDDLDISEVEENTDNEKDPNDEEYFGNGSKDNPYNIIQSQLFQGEKDVWTFGYIVGGFKVHNIFGFTTNPKEFRNTVIAIADSKDETDIDFIIPVELPAGKIRNELNLIDNPHLIGKKIIIKGNLERYYQAPGIKKAKEYIIP